MLYGVEPTVIEDMIVISFTFSKTHAVGVIWVPHDRIRIERICVVLEINSSFMLKEYHTNALFTDPSCGTQMTPTT